MKILFLGTGAADYKAEHREMEGYRRYSSALINDTILIDPGPLVPDAIECFGVDVNKIKYVLVTHLHGDHFNQNTLDWLESHGAKALKLENGETLEIDGYRIRALKGNHSTAVQHYIIDDGKSKIFYGLDSAWLLYEEMRAIKEEKKIDFAVFDGTVGFHRGDLRIFEHCDMNMVISMSEYLKQFIKRFCISHMARTLHTDHATLAQRMAEYGFDVAYDGWSTEF